MTNIAKQGSYVEFTSLSKEMELIPVTENILGALGIFSAEFLNTPTVTIPRVVNAEFLYSDVPWGARVKNNPSHSKGVLTLPIPASAGEDAITPMDVRGKFNWDDIVAANRPETVQALMARKMKTIKQTYANTWSKAMMQVVRDGTAYAPNGTLATSYGSTVNYFTEFGVAQTTVAFDLADQTESPKDKCKAVIRAIQDGFQGGFTPNNFLGIADRGFFDLLEGHPYVIDGMKQVINGQSLDVVLGRLGYGNLSLDGRYEVLEFGGITWVCAAAGEMTANEARVFPLDVPDMFKVFFAPSIENFDTVNATAEQVYYYEYMSDRKDLVEIHHESNFLFATLWPSAIIRCTTTV